jgi:hypothetical protein
MRRQIAGVTEATDAFSLQCNPRSPAGILSSFQESKSGPLLVRAVNRVKATAVLLHDRHHLEFLRSLMHILINAASLSPPEDVESARRLLGDCAMSSPVATITGALSTIAMIKALTGSQQISNYRLMLPGLCGDSSAFRLEVHRPDAPIAIRSMAMEATRATSVRAAVDAFTLWSQVKTPVSAELQSVGAVIEYLEVRCSRSLQVNQDAEMHL